MPSSKITRAQWADAKPRIEHLYLGRNLSLAEVKKDMMARNFEATESQYRTQFKKWGPAWDKNHKTDGTDRLSALVTHRKNLENKDSDVYAWGKPLSMEKVKKLFSRSNPSVIRQLEFVAEGQQRLPRQLAIRTPMPDLTPSLVPGLPFFEVECSLYNELLTSEPSFGTTINPGLILEQQIAKRNDVTNTQAQWQRRLDQTCRDLASMNPTFFTTKEAALNALNSVLPKIGHKTHQAPLLYRQILHSAGNNFSALASFPPEQALQLLNGAAITNIRSLALSPRNYSARSIASSLLKAAIEIDDVTTVQAILKNKALAMDINQPSCFLEHRRVTLIERAITLGHKRIIEFLLSCGADILKTYPCCSSCGLRQGVRCTIEPHGAIEIVFQYDYFRDIEIIRMLLERSTYFGRLELPTNSGFDELFSLFVSKILKTSYKERHTQGKSQQNGITWCPDLWKVVLSDISNDSLLRDLHIWYEMGYDVEDDIVHTVIWSGKLKHLQALLGYGFTPSISTLHSAVLAENEDAVRTLLDYGIAFDDEDETEWKHDTPLELAIRCKGENIIQLLIERGMMNRFDQFNVEWRTAFDKGDMGTVLDLVQDLKPLLINDLSPNWVFQFLDEAWTGAVQSINDTEVIKRLLGLVADLDFKYCCQFYCGVLLDSIRREDEQMVELILSSGADPGTSRYPDSRFGPIYVPKNIYGSSHSFYSLNVEPPDSGPDFFKLGTFWREISSSIEDLPIFVAAKLSNYSIVKILLNAGAIPYLQIAVSQDDVVLASLLFDAGGEINDRVLQFAVSRGDISMVKWLLDHGADPNNSRALEETYSAHRPVFELLIKSHKGKYPFKRKGFASSVLCLAISKGFEPDVRYLLDNGADPTDFVTSRAYIYTQAFSPFGYAIGMDKSRSAFFVEMLLQEGCDPNSHVSEIRDQGVTTQRTTALLAAIGSRNIEVVDMLIRRGAEVNDPPSGLVKRTPLQRAAEIGCFELVELLYNLNADINAPPAVRGGATALQLAAIGGYNRIVCYLLSRKAAVDVPAAIVDGMTALEGAAANGRVDTVFILLRAGAASGGKDRPQLEKAISMARENGHHPTADLIQDYMDSQQGNGGRVVLDDIEEFFNLDEYCST